MLFIDPLLNICCMLCCMLFAVVLSTQGGRRERAIERMGGANGKPTGAVVEWTLSQHETSPVKSTLYV